MANYCLPILATKRAAVEQALTEPGYQFFEVWLDYIEDLELDWLQRLAQQGGKKLIFLFRRRDLATPRMSESAQLEVIKLLENSKVMLDLDFKTQGRLFEKAKRTQLKTILSYHNYKETPLSVELESLVQQMTQHHPEIVKVATQCQSREDAVRLLELLLKLKSQTQRHIVLGMGAHGVITRVFGTLWGNELTFAPKDLADASAPGQLNRDDLAAIFKVLERN